MKLTVFYTIMLVVSTLAIGSPAQAEVSFYVKNCSPHDVNVWTYDGEDKIRLGESGVFLVSGLGYRMPDASEKKLACGLGCAVFNSCHEHCQAHILANDTFGGPVLKIHRDKHVRILKVTTVSETIAHILGTELTYEVTETTRSCEDPVTDAKTRR